MSKAWCCQVQQQASQQPNPVVKSTSLETAATRAQNLNVPTVLEHMCTEKVSIVDEQHGVGKASGLSQVGYIETACMQCNTLFDR